MGLKKRTLYEDLNMFLCGSFIKKMKRIL